MDVGDGFIYVGHGLAVQAYACTGVLAAASLGVENVARGAYVKALPFYRGGFGCDFLYYSTSCQQEYCAACFGEYCVIHLTVMLVNLYESVVLSDGVESAGSAFVFLKNSLLVVVVFVFQNDSNASFYGCDAVNAIAGGDWKFLTANVQYALPG